MGKQLILNDEVVNIIYSRLKEETNIEELPILGKEIEFGLENICLIEQNNLFIFYIMNKNTKECIKIFDDLQESIDYLVNVYDYLRYIEDPKHMKDIFYETLSINETLNLKRK